MTAVMIGVDPHKGSHTAVVIDAAEEPLGEIRGRASAAQAGKLAEWAAAWPERTWAVEGAAGLGGGNSSTEQSAASRAKADFSVDGAD